MVVGCGGLLGRGESEGKKKRPGKEGGTRDRDCQQRLGERDTGAVQVLTRRGCNCQVLEDAKAGRVC